MFLSIVIPSYKPGAMLFRCLESIRQQITCERFEVILVDSSQDETSNLIRHRFPEVKVIELASRAFPGHARNVAMQYASGDVTAFIDAKLCLPPDWLENLKKHFESKDVLAVAGPRRLKANSTRAGTFQFLLEFFDFVNPRKGKRVKYAPAGNSAFRTHTLSSVKFPAGARACEDFVFFERWGRGKILLDRNLTVEYEPVESWRQAFEHIWTLGYWSGVARAGFKIRGNFLSTFPCLAFLLFPYRLIRFVSFSLARLSTGQSLSVLLSLPVFGLGFALWTFAFFRGLKTPKQNLFSLS